MDFALPEIGEGVYEAELIRWLAAPGTAVRPGQGLLEVMTDKATMEVPSPFAGTIDEHLNVVGEVLKVGQPVLRYTPAGEAAVAASPVPPAGSKPASKPLPALPAVIPSSVVAAPSVRQMARKLGIDLATLKGSGPGGRILLDDLSHAVRQAPASVPVAVPVHRELVLDLGKPGTRIKLAGLRRRIAEQMMRSKLAIPHYSYVDELDATALVALRDSVKEHYSHAGIKLTILSFFVKAVAAALHEVPLVNASLDESAGEIVLHGACNVGIAVATPTGLIVPVVRDADKKDIGSIAKEIDRLSNDARAGRARADDLKGGTFTVTSIGSIGGLIATPIINHPEVGIMAIGKVVRRPVYDNKGDLRPADLVYLSFSFDHRVVDGAVGALFGNAVMRYLRAPAALLLPSPL